ncbi:WGR domain-containing protein [Leptospira weilii]|nr:WGR domain-containing protein [Leptospira weilii]
MKHHLTYKDHKLWSIEVSGKSFTVKYRHTNTAGQSQTKTFGSEEECLNEAKKLLNEKLERGYVEGTNFANTKSASTDKKNQEPKDDKPNSIEKWKSIADIKDLQKSLVNAFSHLISEKPFIELLSRVMEKVVGVEVKNEMLYIKFVNEEKALIASTSSNKLQMLSFDELYFGDTGTFEADILESTSLADIEGQSPEVAISDYADWWLYHPNVKNKRNEPALCFISHAGGDIEGPFENSVDEVFLGSLAEYLGIEGIPKLEIINDENSSVGSVTDINSFPLEFHEGKLQFATKYNDGYSSENIQCFSDQSHFVILNFWEHRVFDFSPQPKETFALKGIPYQPRSKCKTSGDQLAIFGFTEGESIISFLECLPHGELTVKNTVKVNLSREHWWHWTLKNDYIYAVNSSLKTCYAISFNHETCNIFDKNDMWGEIEVGIEVVGNKIYRYTDRRVFIFDASNPANPKLLKTKKFLVDSKASSLVMEKSGLIVFFPKRKRGVVLWDTKTDQTYDYLTGIESIQGPMIIGDELWFIMFDQKPVLVCMNVINPEDAIISAFVLPRLSDKNEVNDWFEIKGFCINNTGILILLSGERILFAKRPTENIP